MHSPWGVRRTWIDFVRSSGANLAAMARAYNTPPSHLMGIDDPYAAYCLDEAIADYIGRIGAGEKLRPPKTTDNSELIRSMGGT